MPTFAIQYREVEQSVARRAHNPEVVGSSPTLATKQTKKQPKNGCFFYSSVTYSNCFIVLSFPLAL